MHNLKIYKLSDYINGPLSKQWNETSNNLLLGRYIKEYIDHKKRASIKLDRNIPLICKYLLDEFGANTPLQEITPFMAETLIYKLMRTAPKGAYRYKDYFEALFNQAIKWGKIDMDPFKSFKLPKIQKVEKEYLISEEIDIVAAHASSPIIKDLILYTFLTGSRREEAVNARWEDVDLTNRMLSIGSDEFITKSRKTRRVPITNELLDILIRLKQTKKGKYIFCWKGGRPFSGDYIYRQFKKALKHSKIVKDVTFHSLRHSTASYLMSQNVPLKTIQYWLGHSSISILENYLHINDKDLLTASSTLDNRKRGFC